MKQIPALLVTLCFCAFLIPIKIQAQPAKTAFIVAIGQYKPGTNWKSLSSLRDDSLITALLLKKGFTKFIKVQNEQATLDGIRNGFKQLENAVNDGGIVYIHFSCHGQQLWDDDGILNGDELDGFDECIVPYDAPSEYKEGYKGEKHLRDDELNILVKRIRRKLGPSGEVLVVNDACFSGTSLRGGAENFRGDVKPMKPQNFDPVALKKVKNPSAKELIDSFTNSKLSPVVLISGAKADKPNMEFQNKFGSLSYALNRAMLELKPDESYLKLFGLIEHEMILMKEIQATFQQKPAIEGHLTRTVFQGIPVYQKPYYRVKFINSADVEVEANRVTGIFPGTTVAFMPAGSPFYSPENVLWYDTVSTTTVIDYRRLLFRKVPNVKYKAEEVWMFVVNQTFEKKTTLRIGFEKNFDSKLRTEIESEIQCCSFTEFENNNAELIIGIAAENHFQLYDSLMRPLFAIATSAEMLKQQLLYYQHVKNLISNSFINSKYTTDISFSRYSSKLELDGYLNFSELHMEKENDFFVFNSGEYVKLQITNTSGLTPYYLHAILIDPLGNCNIVAPDYSNHENSADFMLEPHHSSSNMYYKFQSHLPGNYMLKVFITSYPLGFQNLHYPPVYWNTTTKTNSASAVSRVFNFEKKPTNTTSLTYGLGSYEYQFKVK